MRESLSVFHSALAPIVQRKGYFLHVILITKYIVRIEGRCG